MNKLHESVSFSSNAMRERMKWLFSYYCRQFKGTSESILSRLKGTATLF